MILSLRRLVYIFAVLLSAAMLVSCGGDGGGGGGAGTGTLNLSLTDAPDGDYKAVYVTVNEVWVKHVDKDWEMLNGPDLKLPQTLNLLDYVNGFRARLGYAELEAGHYTQMRLILDDSRGAPQSSDANILGHTHPFYNYVIDKIDNKYIEIFLKVPSGGQSGIKLTGGFDIENTESTDIILDFDAHRSIHAHSTGKTGEWRLRPTIKVVEIINSVSGNVLRVVGAAEEALPDARLSAQIYDTTQLMGSPDEVVSVAGTFSDVNGNYFMLLPKNMSGSPYNIVATRTDSDPGAFWGPECQALESTESMENTGIDFTLTQAEFIGTVKGMIRGLPVPVAGDNYSVHLSIRQEANCDDDLEPEMIEVFYKSFVNETGAEIGYGPITLPVGDYELVAWADGTEAIYPPDDLEIMDGVDKIQDVSFPTGP